MKGKLRIKFLFFGGLLLAVAFVASQSFHPAIVSRSKEAELPTVVDLAQEQEVIAAETQPEVATGLSEKRVSIAELKKENEELTKIQDELIKRFIKLRHDHEETKKNLEAQGASGKQQESAEVARLTNERDQLRLKYETAQVQIEQLSQEKQGKLTLSNELSVVNAKAKNLQSEASRLETERAQLELELSKAKSELESTRSGNRGVLQDLESLRSRVDSEKNRNVKEEKRLSEELSQATVNNQRLTQELGALRAEKSGLDAAIKTLREDNSRNKAGSDELVQQLAKQREEIAALNKKVANLEIERQEKEKLAIKLGEVEGAAEQKNSENTKLSESIASLESQLGAKSTKLSSLEEESKAKAHSAEQCEAQLSDARSKLVNMTELDRQLVQLQNELLLKKTELEIYSSSAKPAQPPVRNEARVVRTPAQEIRSGTSSPSALRNPEIVNPSSSPREMIVEVTASKGQLRSGPGKEHGVLMDVREGARLVVEDRQGEWFRVLTPTGTRAYVNQDIVRVVGEPQANGSSGQRIPGKTPARAFGGSPEEAAMQELKRGVSGR